MKIYQQKQFIKIQSGIRPVFQGTVFQNIFQKQSFDYQQVPKVFQSNVFQEFLFQTKPYDKQTANPVFQTGVFQFYVYNVFRKVKQPISDGLQVSE